MIRLLAYLILVFALSASPAMTQTSPPARYAIEVQVLDGPQTLVHAYTYLSETSAASLSLNGEKNQFEFAANLTTQEKDGGPDQVLAVISLIRNGVEIASPQMIMSPGGTAQYVSGVEGGELIRITIKPDSSDPA